MHKRYVTHVVTTLAALGLVLGFSLDTAPAQAKPIAPEATQVAAVANTLGSTAEELQTALQILAMGQARPGLLKPDRLVDSFFDRPANVSGVPGVVVAARDISPRASASVGVRVRATQYKFVTRDSHGVADWATATLLLPVAMSKPQHILVFNDATDSLGLRCQPGAKLASGRQFDLAWGLKQGFGVLVPDHDGLDSEYAATRQTGHIVLDAMRVASRVHPNADFINVGYSGGGLSNYGASMLQQEYAPELNGRVTAYFSGGTPANLSAVVAQMDGDFVDSGILFAAVLGISREYPQVYTLYRPIGLAVGYLMRNACLEEFGALGLLSLPIDTFATPRALYSATARAVFADTDLVGHGRVVPADLLVYHSAGDEMIPYPQALRWYQEQQLSAAPGRARLLWTGSGTHSHYGQRMQSVLQHRILTHYWQN